MQKSIYQDPTFAEYWNERAGDAGEAYKRFVLDPLLFALAGSFKNKTVVDLGCGNGYLTPKFLEHSPKRVILVDISAHNLRYAAEKSSDKRVNFLHQDATEPWKLQTATIDVVYSNMMLNEISNSQAAISEAFRVLKPGGTFVFSVLHPTFDLFFYAQEQAGVPSKKIKQLGGYFRRGHAQFIMSGDSRNNPNLKNKYKQEFEVEHFQRPLCDYFNELVEAGFVVNRLFEPELTKELLQSNPRFSEYLDRPIGLVFYCTKPKA